MRYRAERCLSRKYPGFACTRCQEACPRGLPAGEELPPDCDDCALCARACPAGVYRGEREVALPARPEGSRIHFGCPHPLGGPCLAAVEDGLFLAAALAYPGGVYLDLTACADCDGPGVQVARRVERLNQALAAAGLGVRLELLADGGPWPERFDGSGGAPARRDFLTSLLPLLSFLGRTPGRVWDALGHGSREIFPGLDRGAELSLKEAVCDGCGLCQRVCPASALRLEGSELFYRAESCRGCGLCAELCGPGALLMAGPASLAAFGTEWRSLGAVPAPRCRRCGGEHPSSQGCGRDDRSYLEIWPS